MNVSRFIFFCLSIIWVSAAWASASADSQVANWLVRQKPSQLNAAAVASFPAGKSAYANWQKNQGSVEYYKQSSYSSIGAPSSPRFESLEYVGRDRIDLSTKAVIYDSQAQTEMYYDFTNTHFSRAAELAGYSLQPAIEMVERFAQAKQFHEHYQNYYIQAIQQNHKYLDELRNEAKRGSEITRANMRKDMSELVTNLSTVNSGLLTKEQRQAIALAQEFAQSDLRYNEYELDQNALLQTEQQLKQAVAKSDLDSIDKNLEMLTQAKQNGQSVQPNPWVQNISNSGVMNLKNITGEAGPFDLRKWNTPIHTEEGQVVRRLANRYQKIYSQSSGLSVLDESARARYALGAAALAIGDRQIATQYERGSALIRLSEVMADSVDGFVDGFSDSVTALVRAIPELATMAKAGFVALYEDPAAAWSATAQFISEIDELGAAMWLAISSDYEKLKVGSAYERSKVLGSYTLDLVSMLVSGGSLAAVKGTGRAGSFAKFYSSAEKTVNFAKNASLDVVRAVGKTTDKIYEGVKALHPTTRTGLVTIAKRDAHIAQSILNSRLQHLKLGNTATTDYLDRVAASKTNLTSVRDIEKISDLHPKMMTLVAKESGTSYEGVVSRGIKKGRTPDGRELGVSDVMKSHPGQKYAEGRFTIGGEFGHSGLYVTVGDLKSAQSTIMLEIEVPRVDKAIFAQSNIKIDRLLDLTDPHTLNRLELDQSSVGNKELLIPQLVGDTAKKNNFKGVIYESAKRDGVKNLVLFER